VLHTHMLDVVCSVSFPNTYNISFFTLFHASYEIDVVKLSLEGEFPNVYPSAHNLAKLRMPLSQYYGRRNLYEAACGFLSHCITYD
jgi:hypothetical protein